MVNDNVQSKSRHRFIPFLPLSKSSKEQHVRFFNGNGEDEINIKDDVQRKTLHEFIISHSLSTLSTFSTSISNKEHRIRVFTGNGELDNEVYTIVYRARRQNPYSIHPLTFYL